MRIFKASIVGAFMTVLLMPLSSAASSNNFPLVDPNSGANVTPICPFTATSSGLASKIRISLFNTYVSSTNCGALANRLAFAEWPAPARPGVALHSGSWALANESLVNNPLLGSCSGYSTTLQCICIEQFAFSGRNVTLCMPATCLTPTSSTYDCTGTGTIAWVS